MEWEQLQKAFGEHLRLVLGMATDMAALQEANADKADRVLIMPYKEWQDYTVGVPRCGED